MLPTHFIVARQVRRQLGRPAYKRKRVVDWEAAHAIEETWQGKGLNEPVSSWVRCNRSLTQMAEDYKARYIRTYGPL